MSLVRPRFTPARVCGFGALVAAAAGVAALTLRPVLTPDHRGQPALAPGTPAAAAPIPPRKPDGKVRIGLRRLSGGAALALKLPAGGRIFDGRTGQKLRTIAANAPLKVIADYASGQVLVKGKGVWALRPELSLRGSLIQVGKRRYPTALRL